MRIYVLVTNYRPLKVWLSTLGFARFCNIKYSSDLSEIDNMMMHLTNVAIQKKGDEYKGGTILDPQKGKEYDCKIWLEEDDTNKLNVRGYISFLFRTQNWYRALD